MSDSLDRRRFHELSAVAVSGLIAGTVTGCGSNEPPRKPTAGGPAKLASGEEPVQEGKSRHSCRGLNDCKGQGASGKNDCRGQGDCATVEHHSCGPQNSCKGLGGCGANPGLNDCKGKGGCHVPLMDAAWDKIRQRKEAAWTKASEKFGDAPPKKEAADEPAETPAEK